MNICAAILISLTFVSNTWQKNRGYKLKGKVVGGVDVSISMYPHVVSLTIDGNIYCGGSIIGDRVVVTAGHCVKSQSLKKIEQKTKTAVEILAGTDVPETGFIYETSRLVAHPKYRHISLDYDIGLVFTVKPFEFGPLIQKIDIAPTKRWKNKKYTFTIAGFGVMSTKGGVRPRHLKATRMRYVDSTTCMKSQTSLNFDLPVPDHAFCLIGQKWTGDCHGDSGSGIVWKRYIVGVVSSGRDLYCGSDMTPSMYTDVAYFIKWINATIKATLKQKKATINKQIKAPATKQIQPMCYVAKEKADADYYDIVNYI